MKKMALITIALAGLTSSAFASNPPKLIVRCKEANGQTTTALVTSVRVENGVTKGFENDPQNLDFTIMKVSSKGDCLITPVITYQRM